jgi:sugar phosphate isomerase/epimerase
MLSRRDLGRMALGALPIVATAAKKIDSVIQGVRFGLESHVFSGTGLPRDGIVNAMIQTMVECGLGECDLDPPAIEPGEYWDRIQSGGAGGAVPPEVAAARTQAREELAKWRMSVSLDYFRAIRKRFEDAGIEIYGINGFPCSTEEEASRIFDIAKACGARQATPDMTLATARRVVPLAEKSGLMVAVQGHPIGTNPNLIAKPADFDEALSYSKTYAVSLDIGDAFGGGWDPLDFVKSHHDRTTVLDLKDRRKDRLSVPFGEGDTPVAKVLRLVRDRKYPIRCYIDCDYKTANRPADVRQSFEFARAALA